MPHGQKEMIIDHAMDGGKSAVTRAEVVQYSHSNATYATDGWLTAYGPYREPDESMDDNELEIDVDHRESVTVSIVEPEWYHQLRSDQALRWQESKHA
eukprot:scaffold34507_cov51-Attheya_sp.AAC.1